MKRWLPLLLGTVAACTARGAPTSSEQIRVVDPRMVFGTEAERRFCEETLAEVRCPPNSEPDVFLGPMSEEGSAFCSVVCMRGDVEHGPYVVRNASTSRSWESGQYADGKPHGRWVHRARDHRDDPWRLVSIRHYDNGKLDGLTRAWHSDDQLQFEGLYLAGEKHGEWTHWSPRGGVLTHGHFDRGVPVGVHERRYRNGHLQRRKVFDEEGRPHGEFCFWEEDGTLIECYEIEFGTGSLREYRTDGTLASEQQMKDGELHGKSVHFAAGGGKRIEHYHDGLWHGAMRDVDADGCVQTEANYSGGKADGRFVERDCAQPPVVTTEGEWCDGSMCGTWTERDGETGAIISVTEYAADGTMLSETLYEDGVPTGHHVYDGSAP